MSNPSIVTKLLTLVKGAFGSKEAAPAPAAAPAAKEPRGEGEGNSAPEQGNAAPAETAEAPEPAGAPEKSETAEPAGEKPAESVTETSSEAPAAETPAAEAPVADSAPATDDVPEKDAAIAQELSTNEAHTEVASDDVLERVRKGAAPAAEDLAVPTYDELTLPSIRARLRKLTIDQVRDLRAYEVAHESRPEFIKMYDNRIAKLQAEEN
ncbi:hypothetical protein IDM40_16035 [Nocardiopsis sp. HNM0947]|uniref:DUF8129 domain-containing protein n=1 Tax=Nocardiopsis coralli TaxID=2772213 RepID=A0ABR9P8R3_9ACTN|nr:hypothetical protein [Nocardiopsis coralli]MBE3000199.1 hypothetical protein [Nocardiopsis coralli]